jgi:hypothetical protein
LSEKSCCYFHVTNKVRSLDELLMLKHKGLLTYNLELILGNLLGLILAGTAAGQTTSLQASLSHESGGHPRIVVTNSSTADARAYVIECKYLGPGGNTATYSLVREGIGGPPYAIKAGKKQEIACPLNSTSVTVKAAAFDDGHTEGDAQTIAQLVKARQIEAQDVADAIQVLQSALTAIDPTGSPTPGSSTSIQFRELAAEFAHRAQVHANTTLSPVAKDYVCTWIARTLAHPQWKESPIVLLQGYIAELNKFAAVLPKPKAASTSSSAPVAVQ